MSFFPNPHPPHCPWFSVAERFGAPNIKWCEETICSIISEPANTWSNLSYIILAIISYQTARKINSKFLIYLSIAHFIMGWFSLIYHASNNYLTQILDFIGMYLFLFWIIGLNFIRMNYMNFKQMKVFYILANILGVLLVHLSYINNIKFQFIIAVLALTIMVTEFLAYKKRTAQYRLKYFALSLLFLFVAQVFSQLDIHRIWCEPTNHIILQGHALWHLFAGIGCFLASKHFEEVVLTKSAHNLSQSLS